MVLLNEHFINSWNNQINKNRYNNIGDAGAVYLINALLDFKKLPS